MTEAAPHRRHYERGMALAEAGKHAEALACIEQHLARHPDDVEAANDLAALLHALGRSEEAVDHLKRVVATAGCPPQALWNLAEASLAAGRPQEAAAIFDRLNEQELLSFDLVNRTAAAMLDAGELAGATEALLRSLAMLPEQEKLLRPMLAQIRRKRLKIAFFLRGGAGERVSDVYEYLHARFDVRPHYDLGEDDQQAVGDAMQWCDLAWFDGLTAAAVLGSRKIKTCRIVLHIHQEDAAGAWLDCIWWPRVDMAFADCNARGLASVRRVAAAQDPNVHLVPMIRGVDLEVFAFSPRERGKQLAWAGRLDHRQNPALLIQCFGALHRADGDYRLAVAGVFEDRALEEYLFELIAALDLVDAVRFDGWQEDLPAWLAPKHYIVSTGIQEAVPNAVLKGMACGLKPLVHVYPGCRDHWRDEDLFASPEEFRQAVMEGPYEPEAYRRRVADGYALSPQREHIGRAMAALERTPLVAEAPPEAAGDGEPPAAGTSGG